MGEGTFQTDTQEDFKSLLFKTGACGNVYEPEHSKEDLKGKEKEESAAASKAERQAQPVGWAARVGSSWSKLVV